MQTPPLCVEHTQIINRLGTQAETDEQEVVERPQEDPVIAC